MMTILAVLVGFTLAAWVLTSAAVAYALWRYAYQPWRVVRADVAALNAKVDQHVAWAQATMTTRRMSSMTDEELASVERRLRRDSASRAQGERVIR